MQDPKKPEKSNDLPPELKQEILSNGAAMQKFYEMPTEKRQAVLDGITATNKKLDKLDQ